SVDPRIDDGSHESAPSTAQYERDELPRSNDATSPLAGSTEASFTPNWLHGPVVVQSFPPAKTKEPGCTSSPCPSVAVRAWVAVSNTSIAPPLRRATYRSSPRTTMEPGPASPVIVSTIVPEKSNTVIVPLTGDETNTCECAASTTMSPNPLGSAVD